MENNEYKEIKDKLDEILKILNGNGKMGLCAKVTVMWNIFLFIALGFCGQIFIIWRMSVIH
jgi:hypothetical protein